MLLELVLPLPGPVGDKAMLLGGNSTALSSPQLLASPDINHKKRRKNILPRDIGKGDEELTSK